MPKHFMLKKILLTILFSFFLFQSAWAQSFIPPSLQEWISWVKKDDPTIDCPFMSNEERPCAWASLLKLDLGQAGGSFEQQVEVFAPSFVALPGDEKNPALDVTANGSLIPHVSEEGISSVYLQKGHYSLKGHFVWKKMPENLMVDTQIGLILLSVNGVPVSTLKREEDGHVWLKRETSQTLEGDNLALEVFRKLDDGIPLQLTTYLDLKISGQNREVRLGAFLPADFIPLTLSSTLPAKIEADGSLSIQLRPGDYHVEIISRHPGNATTIEIPKIESPWPESEIWAWQPHSVLRQVDLEGLDSIDPKQTNLPAGWKNLASYLANPNQKLNIIEKSRGLASKRADQLTLSKMMWLDFDGKGLTIKDVLSGSLNNGFRLESQPEMKLGRVSVNGQDQLITQITGQKEGVEIRDKDVSVDAEGRLMGSFMGIPASGWQHDFQSVSTTLHLPPGWRLLAARGVDKAYPSWVSQWTLMDFFLILIVTIGVYKLFGIQASLLALITLGITYHEVKSPDFLWPALLAFTALNRYVKKDSLWGRLVRISRLGFILFMLFSVIPFAIHQVRVGLHPVLEYPGARLDDTGYVTGNIYPMGGANAPMEPPGVAKGMKMADQMQGAEDVVPAPAVEQALRPTETNINSYQQAKETSSMVQKKLNRADPNAKVQTGMGLSNWHWNDVTLNWSGPVASDNKMSLFLISPPINMVLSLLRVLLALALLGFLLEVPLKDISSKLFKAKKLLVLLALSGLMFLSPNVFADFPEQGLLDALKIEVSKNPECYPNCAEIEKVHVAIDKDELTINLRINSMALTALPLPQSADWSPQIILVDAQEAPLYRDGSHMDWVLASSGVHDVVLKGILSSKSQVAISFQSAPQKITTQLNGWASAGVDEEGRLSGTLELIRQGAVVSSDETEIQDLSPFVRIEREFYFGMEWEIVTHVIRQGRTGAPLVIEYPLMEGEFITGDEPKVTQGKARLVIPPQDTEVSFNSRLNIIDKLELKASPDSQWVETWKLMSSPLWHVASSGLVAVSRAQSSGELFTFQPWPGESLNLDITKPEAVPGPTMAMENVTLDLSPGLRSTDMQLGFSIRSSLATIHEIVIPRESEMKEIRVNGVEEPLSFADGHIRLNVKPGSQNFVIKWSDKQGVKSWYKSPIINLGMPHVNIVTNVDFPTNRWILKACGKGYGPVMLFWNYLAVLFIAGFILTKLPYNFLRLHQWFLLGLGLTQVTPGEAVLLALWFFSLGYRKEKAELESAIWFNLRQMGLVLLSLLAIGILINAIQTGLLGQPQMQIMGNASYGSHLQWFLDRSSKDLPAVWVLSVPLWIYRILMLLWALWLANAFIGWIRFGWQAFTASGAWKQITTIVKPTK